MMKDQSKRWKVYIFVVMLCIGIPTAVAQTDGTTALTSYLHDLETTFNVRFSYDAVVLAQATIRLPEPYATIEESLVFLSKTTPFNYEKIDNRYITVTPRFSNYICGTVLDKDTLEPIEGVAVNTASSAITTTNELGFFVIPYTPSESYFFSHIAFVDAPLEKVSANDGCNNWLLTPMWSELEEVVVQSIFTEGISKQSQGFFRINTKNFGLLPGQVDNDVLQIIQSLPGVESADETISNINIRGGTQDENLILWNDIRMYQSGHFFGLISAFNPDLTRRVDVYKNGTHPRFGESVSGVIDMQSKNTTPDSIKGAVGFNFINGSAYAEIPVSEKLGIQVSGRSSANTALKTPTYKTYSQRIFQDSEITNVATSSDGALVNVDETFNFYDLSTRALYDISEKSKLKVHFLGMDNQLDFTENLEESDQSKNSGLDQRSLAGGITWEQQFSEDFRTSLLTYGSYYVLKALNRDVFTTQELRQENEILDTGIKLDAFYRFFPKFRIQGGYHFSEIGIANEQDVNLPRFRSYKKEVLRSHALFLNGLFTLGTTQLQTGVRYNYFGKLNKGIIEPRLSIFQPLGNHFSAELLGEFKSQTTTQRIDFQSDFLGIEKRRWVLADEEEVPVIESKQVSLGFQYDPSKWFVSAEGFYKHVEGITTSNQGFQNQFQFVQSIGSYDVYGTEFIINRKARSFSVWMSYLYLNNTYSFENLSPSSFRHNLDINHSLTFAGSYTFKKLQISMGVKWHSGRPYTEPVAGNELTETEGQTVINFRAPNSSRLPSYVRTDLSAKYLLRINSNLDAQLNVALLNVLDTKNTLNIRYALDTDAEETARVNEIAEFSLGFTPNFSFQLLF